MSSFQRLIRFEANDGSIVFGDVTGPALVPDLEGTPVAVLEGNLETGFSRTRRTATVKRLSIPKYPVIFAKPPDALAGHGEVIPVHPDAQARLDYEGELAVIIGRSRKDIVPEEALEYVLGYSSSNDISAKNFQVPADISGGQYCFAKSFDKFAPLGPCIVSPELIPDPQVLFLTTKVNGALGQQTSTVDMIWSVKQIISFASKGTTLRKGTVILTGTPSGVGLFMNPPGFLKSGDLVEVEIEKLGILSNRILFSYILQKFIPT
ncbi:hypothetical protein DV736_g4304, partial [Chaetothyriales sp. CBS 134916]